MYYFLCTWLIFLMGRTMKRIDELTRELGFKPVLPIRLNFLRPCYINNDLWYVYVSKDYSDINKVRSDINPSTPILFLFSVLDEEFSGTELDYIKASIEIQLKKQSEDNIYEGFFPESWLY